MASTDQAAAAAPAPSSGDLLARRDVKGVPFYGESGEAIGVRVTGLRPGGAFEKLGLQRGDVVLRCGDDEVTTIVGLVRHACGTPSLQVRREVDGRVKDIDLRGS